MGYHSRRGDRIWYFNSRIMDKISTEKDVEKVVVQYIQQGFIDKKISIGIEKR